MKLGFQMYSIREQIKTEEGLIAALQKLGQMGYETVQGVSVQEYDVSFWQKHLEENGLEMVCPLYSKNIMLDDTDAMIKHLRGLGCDTFMMSWLTTDGFVSLEGTLKNWEPYHDAIAKLEDAGIVPTYHNHDFEFSKLLGYDGIYYEWLLETYPRWRYILDVAWTEFARTDTLGWMEKLGPQRLQYLHFKDYYNRINSGHYPVFAPCGDGILNLKPFAEKAKAMGVVHAIVEQDNATACPDPFEEAARSAAYMKTIL